QPYGIDLVTHQAVSFASALSPAPPRDLGLLSSVCAGASFTTTVSWANGLLTGLMRPRPRAWKRRMTRFLPTCACATTRSLTSRLWLFSALATADMRHF